MDPSWGRGLEMGARSAAPGGSLAQTPHTPPPTITPSPLPACTRTREMDRPLKGGWGGIERDGGGTPKVPHRLDVAAHFVPARIGLHRWQPSVRDRVRSVLGAILRGGGGK
ncbi:hypothetical protein MATL_G00242620 [Megalops atlanticus]|uniref:Uncharacterized protein n=1 Tax=Megalops atlanticus TaxID=7932 RepID=A0A9D3PCK5_MEGAT|nr:hypothetical protein MATL_G00242620 [Megalops atlanticus]